MKKNEQNSNKLIQKYKKKERFNNKISDLFVYIIEYPLYYLSQLYNKINTIYWNNNINKLEQKSWDEVVEILEDKIVRSHLNWNDNYYIFKNRDYQGYLDGYEGINLTDDIYDSYKWTNLKYTNMYVDLYLNKQSNKSEYIDMYFDMLYQYFKKTYPNWQIDKNFIVDYHSHKYDCIKINVEGEEYE